MKHKSRKRYEGRYRYKLNMLEPGSIMLKITGVLLAAGIISHAAGWRVPSIIFLSLGGAVFAVLLILLAVEAHQDRVLNEIAMRENNKSKH